MTKSRFWSLVLGLIVVLAGVLYVWPLPKISGQTDYQAPAASLAAELPWPAYGQGAIGAKGYGVLQTHGEQKAAPIASVAKVITALAVLKQKPLQPGQSGPNITITANDVAIYNDYYVKGGSVAKVVAGEQLSEYQALQAMLIPSANNMADTLAVWAFGSVNDYTAYANNLVKGMGLTNTIVADASGFSPGSVSSANDLVKLGLAVMDNPVIADIVSQQSASIPVAGSINNVNWLLGSDGVIGIKTGNIEQSGGCFLFAANRLIFGQTMTIVGAILQAPDLNTVIKDARSIIRASDGGFEKITVASKGQVIGDYNAPWQKSAAAIVSQDLNVINWRGNKVQTDVILNYVTAPAKAGAVVGKLSATVGRKTTRSVVALKSDMPAPNWIWRIFQ